MKKSVLIIGIVFLLFNGKIFGQNPPAFYNLSADEAKLHIGEKHEVDGHFFKTEVRRTKKHDTWLILTYMSGSDHTKAAFVDVKTVTVKNDDSIARSKDGNVILNFTRKNIEFESRRQLNPPWDKVGAAGKIIWFEGLPAVKTTIDDVNIFEPVS